MLKTSLAKIVAVAVLTGSSLVVGAAATPAVAAADETPTACQQVWDSFPAAMQADIEAAVQLPLRERRRALVAIRYAALHGVYGDDVQQWAEMVKERRVELWKKFPEQLKADVRAARSLPLREQRRAIRAIRYAALHGVYGAWVQSLAEKRLEFVQGCPDIATPFVDNGPVVA